MSKSRLGTRRKQDTLLAEQFNLPPAVRSEIRNADDPVDLVRAILEAGGVSTRIEGDLVIAGDHAVVILGTGHGGCCIPREALNHAYFRVQESGMYRGLVIALGYMNRADIERRESLAPHILHTGSRGIQRMADAVASGANPLGLAFPNPNPVPQRQAA
jgi:hypothetical protein